MESSAFARGHIECIAGVGIQLEFHQNQSLFQILPLCCVCVVWLYVWQAIGEIVLARLAFGLVWGVHWPITNLWIVIRSTIFNISNAVFENKARPKLGAARIASSHTRILTNPRPLAPVTLRELTSGENDPNLRTESTLANLIPGGNTLKIHWMFLDLILAADVWEASNISN
jgi:hypothetical protein